MRILPAALALAVATPTLVAAQPGMTLAPQTVVSSDAPPDPARTRLAISVQHVSLASQAEAWRLTVGVSILDVIELAAEYQDPANYDLDADHRYGIKLSGTVAQLGIARGYLLGRAALGYRRLAPTLAESRESFGMAFEAGVGLSLRLWNRLEAFAETSVGRERYVFLDYPANRNYKTFGFGARLLF